MQIIYALVWGIIFGFLGYYLTSTESNILGYGAYIMGGLSAVTLYKSLDHKKWV